MATTKIESHAEDYAELSRHYMTPEQVDAVPYPPHGKQHGLYHTAHALVSERHEKSDLVEMVYALLLKWDAEVAGLLDRAERDEAALDGITRHIMAYGQITRAELAEQWAKVAAYVAKRGDGE